MSQWCRKDEVTVCVLGSGPTRYHQSTIFDAKKWLLDPLIIMDNDRDCDAGLGPEYFNNSTHFMLFISKKSIT